MIRKYIDFSKKPFFAFLQALIFFFFLIGWLFYLLRFIMFTPSPYLLCLLLLCGELFYFSVYCFYINIFFFFVTYYFLIRYIDKDPIDIKNKALILIKLSDWFNIFFIIFFHNWGLINGNKPSITINKQIATIKSFIII